MLVCHSTELMTGLPGMFGLCAFGKIWNCGALTPFVGTFLVVKVDSSSCFLKLSMVLLTMSLCFLVGS